MAFSRTVAARLIARTRPWTIGGLKPTPLKPEILRGVRAQSTHSTSETSTTTKSFLSAPIVLFAGALLGGGATAAYYFSSSSSSLDAHSQVVEGPAGLNNAYGSPADFQRAIEELRAAFPAEHAVSTDAEDLHVHGFSDNDYHPGL
ncbi:hypothetical protein EIP86_005890 [Pleurotus ostreatoroseus]|nr:hypothetical protein EIP86_005890 [Pleurotus ostreatoroseus]